MISKEDEFTDDVYKSLKAIQKETNIKLSDKAYIAIHLTKKLIAMGYAK